MPAFQDITGQRFGRLTVISIHKRCDKSLHAQTYWLCKCDCGAHKIVGKRNLGRNTNSCGCLWWDTFVTHGQTKTPEYRAWESMHQRCRNPQNKAYKNYGGRGISVCNRWLKFENFIADMGSRPKGYSIERIDNDGNYEPSNCKWIPLRDQAKNQRSAWHAHVLAPNSGEANNRQHHAQTINAQDTGPEPIGIIKCWVSQTDAPADRDQYD